MTTAKRVLMIDELLYNIFKYLSLHDLGSSSLVSRGWQATAFPRLYCSVYLSIGRHLESITKRVLNNQGQLSIPAYVRKLVLEDNHHKIKRYVPDMITEDDLNILIAALPRLTRLEDFAWELSFIPCNSAMLKVLQVNCPNLKSIQWKINDRVATDCYEGKF